ncbi:MAG: hypothetical protein JW973_01025 [Bacteroidales bacterium]|nr:hypothetical protein [Bacteroidales bacterium]
MNKFFLLIVYWLIPILSFSQSLPDGYILLYQQNFSASAAIKDFKFSDPASWEIKSNKENRFLEFTSHTRYVPPFRSPAILGIVTQHIFGDFILQADLMQSNSETEHSNICIFFSVKDSSHFYYIQLASGSDDSTHGIFLVKNAPRCKVSNWQTSGINWGNGKWNRVRVERSIVNRIVNVYFNDMKNPVMTTKNPELVMGYIGFGSFDGSGRIDNVKIWGPTSIPQDAGIFESKISP